MRTPHDGTRQPSVRGTASRAAASARTLVIASSLSLLASACLGPSGAPHDPPDHSTVAPVPASVRPGIGVEGRAPEPPERPRVGVPDSPVIVVKAVQPANQRQSGAMVGRASWYCGAGSPCTAGYPSGLYAAAGPALRVGLWRGRKVAVEAQGRRVVVTLIDWCACPGGRVIDLYRDSFSRLADPSVGVVEVTVSWEADGG